METTSFHLNISDVGLLREFPYWRLTLAINLCSLTFVFVGTLLVLYLPLLLMLLGKIITSNTNVHFRSLYVIHMSLLTATIVEDILIMIVYVSYQPSIHRYCICSDSIGTILAGILLFFIVYRPVIFSCLAILQLLVVLGKKRFLKVKITCGMITMCIGASLIMAASFIKIVYESNEKPICNTCYCPGYRSESSFGLVARISVTVTLIIMLPSLIIVITTSVWSCALFRSYYIGGDDQLNRRMLSLPFIMPLTILASAILEVAIVMLVGRFLIALSLGEYFPHWIVFAHLELTAVLRLISRSIYPLVLIYTHASLYQAIKNLLKWFKIDNRITPLSDL